MHYICPLCQQPLICETTRWYCGNKHSFDIAKQGYCNLLPVQHKKSRSPGDDKTMVAARQRFLNAGHYQAIASAVNQQVAAFIKDQLLTKQSATKTAVIDAGCGEGYYTDQLFQYLTNLEALLTVNQPLDILGTDISKQAIQAAARRNPDIQWLVANSTSLPVEDSAADILLCLFSPIISEEFQRCLQDSGQLIVASTGPEHLLELRQRLYNEVKQESYQPHSVLQAHFKQVASTHVYRQLALADNRSILDLLSMTPHYWRASPERKRHLQSVTQLDLTLDIQIQSFMPV